MDFTSINNFRCLLYKLSNLDQSVIVTIWLNTIYKENHHVLPYLFLKLWKLLLFFWLLLLNTNPEIEINRQKSAFAIRMIQNCESNHILDTTSPVLLCEKYGLELSPSCISSGWVVLTRKMDGQTERQTGRVIQSYIPHQKNKTLTRQVFCSGIISD